MAAAPAVDQALDIGRQLVGGVAVRESDESAANAPVIVELDVLAGRFDEQPLGILGKQAFPGSAAAPLVLGILAAVPVVGDLRVGG
jgi:hypothetical protein